MEKKKFQSKLHSGGYLNYYYHCDSVKEKCPLVVYVHGAGSRGSELSQMGIVGPLAEIENGRVLDAIFVAPQCHGDTWFELFEMLIEFVDTMRQDPKVDMSRVYLCGVSMGAYASWQLAMTKPEWFAALVAVCGGGMYWNAKRLKELPIWAFHGVLDKVVLPDESVHMVDAVNRAGGNAKITLFPNVAHNAWEGAFSCEEMWKWLFQQQK